MTVEGPYSGNPTMDTIRAMRQRVVNSRIESDLQNAFEDTYACEKICPHEDEDCSVTVSVMDYPNAKHAVNGLHAPNSADTLSIR
jgi:hypothetical protein